MEKSTTKARRQSESTTSDAIDVGMSFGDFRILKKLGQGGMGDVFLAEQISLKRKVAIKMLRGDIIASGSTLARFQAESKTIAKLSHANVVQAYMVGEHQGNHYLVMEYVQGVSLGEYISRQGALEVPLVLSIMRQVASALQRASELGIVHRDIKPGNILLTRKAEAKVADFGLARCLSEEERVDLTRAGSTVGTPLYMSPEQIEGKALDGRSDIYSFGVTCYQMLTGQLPFNGSNAFVIASKHVNEEPTRLEKVNPDLPPAVCKLIRKMMAKKPEARYATVRELLQDIAKVRQSLGNATQTMAIGVEETPVEVKVTPAPATPLWKRPIVLALGGIAALGLFAVLAVGIVVAVTMLKRPDPVVNPDPRAQLPDRLKTIESPVDPTEALKQKVDKILKESSPKLSDVDSCIDLAVHYLDEEKNSDAEAVFKRMAEHKQPHTYYLLGRLGLAVTASLNNDHKGSRAEFAKLFDTKAKDNRAQLINDYLTRKQEFGGWVNEADSQNVTKIGSGEPSLPKGFQGFKRPTFKMPTFKKG